MFLDSAVIYCKAGNGGDGVVSYHREKYRPKGGPDGGDGGKGGDICFTADESLNTLVYFRYNQHFRAGDGEAGGGNFKTGKSGEDIIVKVPCGTVVKDAESGGILADVFKNGEKILIFEGGRGGRGNSRFCTATRHTPNFCEDGEKTVERKLSLELKTIADVGLVGFPNVGKSTLLSVISAAKPKIAPYPFTTTAPNLGVAGCGGEYFVAADIPGLIEGAHAGTGLGHKFLRHIERVRMIVHIVDVSGSEGRNPVEDYKIIRAELEKYDKKMARLPEIVAANKIDLGYSEEVMSELEKACGGKVIKISAATTEGTGFLVKTIVRKLADLPPLKPLEFVKHEYGGTDKTSFKIEKIGDIYCVSGGLMEELARKTYLDDAASNIWFQKQLKERGVIDELKKSGMKDGDTVRVLDMDFTYSE